MAHAGLGIAYSNLNQPSLAADYLKKAFDLRDRVTEREKFHVTAQYYEEVTGELEKAKQTYELWKQAYPRDYVPYGNLGSKSSCPTTWPKTRRHSAAFSVKPRLPLP
jgi:eukaryotic-like serine/threonine-protein kinase